VDVEHTIWNAVLSIGVSVVGFVLKSVFDELKRLQVLINKTREEVAKEYVTKAQLDADINRIFDRLDRLESKIDRLMEQHK
jgi:predicted nuclease with TOPRIM domain